MKKLIKLFLLMALLILKVMEYAHADDVALNPADPTGQTIIVTKSINTSPITIQSLQSKIKIEQAQLTALQAQIAIDQATLQKAQAIVVAPTPDQPVGP